MNPACRPAGRLEPDNLGSYTWLMKANETIDSFLNGKLQIIQSRQGYRFSVDALLLAEFVSIKNKDFVYD